MVAGAGAVERSVAGESLEQRFTAFVGTHRDRARRVAWRLVGGDDAAAEDVTQDAFAKAYHALGRFREDSRLETWFYRILLRQAHNHRRWRAVRQRWSGGSSEEVADPSSEVPGDLGLRRRIGEALGRLTRRQREAFILVHMEGFTVCESATLLGKPTGTVKSHLHRALKTLRAELADLQDFDGGSRT